VNAGLILLAKIKVKNGYFIGFFYTILQSLKDSYLYIV